MSELLLDRAGRRRSPATMPGFHAGRPPRNKGLRYPADPPKVEEITAVMRAAGDDAHGRRLRGLIVVLWRAGLRINEALALAESDLDQRRGALLVRRAKGGRRREVGMDAWGWEELQPWLVLRLQMPVGTLFCVIKGPDAGPALVRCRRTRRFPQDRDPSQRQTAVRAPPTPARPCGRTCPRRRGADRHPAPARPQRSRHHVGLLAGHRQRRNHRDRPCPPPAHDPRQHFAAALSTTRRGAAHRAEMA